MYGVAPLMKNMPSARPMFSSSAGAWRQGVWRDLLNACQESTRIVEEVDAERGEDEPRPCRITTMNCAKYQRRWPRSKPMRNKKIARNFQRKQSGGEVRVEIQADQRPGDDDPAPVIQSQSTNNAASANA